MSGPPATHAIHIDQARAKLALAVMAHLRQIERTVVADGKYRRPGEMDQGELVLCAAALRALFFDDSPAPMLRTLLGVAFEDLQIEAMEADLGLVLLSELIPDDFHVSDFFVHALLDPKARADHPLDEEFEVLHAFMDRMPFEDMMRDPQRWVPKLSESASGPTHMSNVGPSQLLRVCRRRRPAAHWGEVQIGALKAIPIRRKVLIKYVANKLGGVHYESKRLPSVRAEAEEFKILASAMDWDNQAIMHAGLVAVAIACIEVMSSEVGLLTTELVRFHDARQARLHTLRVGVPESASGGGG